MLKGLFKGLWNQAFKVTQTSTAGTHYNDLMMIISADLNVSQTQMNQSHSLMCGDAV